MAYIDWLKIYSSVVEGNIEECPECGNNNIKVKLAGRHEDHMGYGIVWCEDCKAGIRLSRVKIPEGVSFIPMDQAQSEFAEIENIRFVDDEQ